MNQADIEKYAFLYFCGEKDMEGNCTSSMETTYFS